MSTDVQWERLIDLIVQQLRQRQFYMINTAWEVSKYGVFPGQYVLYSTEYRKIQTRKNSVFDNFHAVKQVI